MLNVKNKKVISKLANNSFKANKLRNIFAIVAIILTTVMFTTLFTVGMSMKDTMEESTMRQTGVSAHGGFKYLSQEEYDKLKTHPLIKEIELSVILGVAENQKLKKHYSEIRYGSDRQAELYFASPTTGNMPKSYNEVAMDTVVLDYLGLSYELGQEVELEYSLNGEMIKDKFILSGYWEGDKVIPGSQIWISREYIDSKLENYISQGDNDYIGKIFADVMFKNSSNIDGNIQQVITESGYIADDIAYGVNWAYMSASGDTDVMMVFVVIGALLLIMFCGYLIIYNIFFISISKDIRFYGLLKTIGTTSKQIGKIIRKQSLILSLIGIPLGLVIGYLIGVAIVPMVLGQMNIAMEKVSINPVIFIGAAIFSLITVLISVMKPAKIAGKVSPIEALPNTEGKVTTKATSKKRNGGKISKMAFANVFRSGKKALIVTISLSLSLIILNCTYSIVTGFDMDAYLSKMINSDFVIADSSYFNVSIGYNGEEAITEDFLADLEIQDGVDGVGTIKFIENMFALDNTIKNNVDKIMNESLDIDTNRGQWIKDEIATGYLFSHIYGVDKIAMDKVTVFKGELDYEKLKSGKYIIVSTDEANGNYYNVGDKVTIDYENGKSKEYEIMAIANFTDNLSVRHSHSVDLEFLMSDEEFTSQIGEVAPMISIMDVDENYEANIEAFIKNYCENINTDMDYESKESFKAEFESMQVTYTTIGGLLSFIIAAIGIINFINTMITSVISRKNELAMIQSIGMTKKQMQQMLMWEGVTYALLTSIFVLTIGVLISQIGVSIIMKGLWYFAFKIRIVPMLICLPILFIIALIVPIICYKFVSKDSIVERLRDI